ncbi:M81 family metallopeptidase [Sphaerobacter sp.]|uniref:M81 family metallopeptidase n=1 Tax=Sphaerobacter sp. TaxID=2099654 RepID=UPI001D3A62F6|nr:M81 family metallopeptidase [Sphaerobacter sp.]MBX5443804.1 M81 family metallopeptidase [Sphaerobacter sp.]
MRFAIGAIWHQTNSFSPVPTTLEDFAAYRYVQGDALIDTASAGHTALAGAIRTAAHLSHDVLPLIEARAPSGGPLSDADFERLTSELCSRLREARDAIDGVLLDLSGGLITTSDPDAEATLLTSVREVVGGAVPIVAAVGPHANLSPRLVDAATLLVGPSAVPDADPAARGERAVALLALVASGEVKPAVALRQVPLLVPLPAQDTGAGAMAEIAELARQCEREPGVLCAMVTGGFPYADVPHAGAAVVVATHGDSTRAADLAATVEAAFAERNGQWTVNPANIEAAIHDAMAAREHPFVLADTGDDPGAGGPGDGTGLLWGLLDLGARGAAIGVITDPEAVDAAIAAGVGAEVTLSVGARRDRLHGYPIDVHGRVASIGPGKIVREGPLDSGLEIDMGRSVVVEARGRHEGDVAIILAERRVELDDPAIFRAHGIDPATMRILAVKSSLRYRVGFGAVASKMVAVATPGVTVPDFAFFPYQRLRRPIAPLDPL